MTAIGASGSDCNRWRLRGAASASAAHGGGSLYQTLWFEACDEWAKDLYQAGSSDGGTGANGPGGDGAWSDSARKGLRVGEGRGEKAKLCVSRRGKNIMNWSWEEAQASIKEMGGLRGLRDCVEKNFSVLQGVKRLS